MGKAEKKSTVSESAHDSERLQALKFEVHCFKGTLSAGNMLCLGDGVQFPGRSSFQALRLYGFKRFTIFL